MTAQADIVQMLASAIGLERAKALVEGVASQMGHDIRSLSADAKVEVLTTIGARPGVEGIAARMALTRLRSARIAADAARTEAQNAAPWGPEPRRHAVLPRQGGGSQHLSKLVALLAPTLGEERANQLVMSKAMQLGLPQAVSLPQATRVLDEIGGEEGMVGIAARFALSRLHLSWSRDAS